MRPIPRAVVVASFLFFAGRLHLAIVSVPPALAVEFLKPSILLEDPAKAQRGAEEQHHTDGDDDDSGRGGRRRSTTSRH